MAEPTAPSPFDAIGQVLIELYEGYELVATERIPAHMLRGAYQVWLHRIDAPNRGYRLRSTGFQPAGAAGWVAARVDLSTDTGDVLSWDVPVELYAHVWAVPSVTRLPSNLPGDPIRILALRVTA